MSTATAPRTVDLFAGPGGWDEGARKAGLDLGIEGLELGRDACATARAAGHRRRQVDVRTVSPAEYEQVTGLICSPPCPTFSASGLRTGLGDDYQKVLDTWTSIGWGYSPEDAVTCVDDVRDPRTALLAIAGMWALALPNLEWIAMEQVPAVEEAFVDLAAELYSIGWETVGAQVCEALDHGGSSRRRRAFLFANRYGTASLAPRADRPQPPTMAQVLGWSEGHHIITRGNMTGDGGNRFSADQPSWCLTGSSRSWVRDDGLRLTAAEAGLLNGFRADYPWQGSRTSRFLQAADVVAPPMAAAVLTAAIGARAAITHASLAA